MSDEPEKPKKVRDIRERLGRTTSQPEPPREGNEDVVPPPPSTGGVAPPPGFVGGRGAKRAGPFTAPTAGAKPQQEVRIVVDEEAVTTAAEGHSRRSRRLMMITGAFATLAGLAIGGLATYVLYSWSAYDQAVEDGKAIYEKVYAAADQVNDAKVLLDQAIAAAKSKPGVAASVDYAAIQKLGALPIPFTPEEFTGRRYDEFDPATVNSLFTYTRNVAELWDGLKKLAVRTDGRRSELDEAAKDETAITTSPTGCVPTLGEGGFRCGLVYVDIPDEAQGGGSTKVKVRPTRGSRPIEKEVFRGQDLRQSPSNYVIITNPQYSGGVLGQRQNAFSQYRKELASLSSLMDTTLQTQGALEKGVGTVASLQEP